MPDVAFDPQLMIETGADGRLAEGDRAQVAALAKRAVEQGHLVVHLHGGLVSSASGRRGAVALAPHFRDAGALPVAFVWRTDPTIVCRNLDEIAKEKIFRRLLLLVVKWAVGKITGPVGGKGVTEALPADSVVRSELKREDQPAFAALTGTPTDLTDDELSRFQADVEADLPLQEAAASLVKADAASKGAGAVGAPVPTHLDAGVLAEIGGGGAGGKGILSMVAVAKHAGAVLLRVVRRFAQGRDHGVHATCVEEIAREFYLADAGAVLWDTIKVESADTFEAVVGEERGGRLFVEALVEAAKASAPPRISIVAHSAGSIFACHLLPALAARGIVVTDLVFVAAAVRYALFESTLVALADHAPRRMHFIGLEEECEAGYWEVPAFYPRSLLYMVSGAAERDEAGESLADVPLVGMRRFYDARFLGEFPRAAAAMATAGPRWVGKEPDGTVHKHGGLADPEASPAVVATIEGLLRAAP